MAAYSTFPEASLRIAAVGFHGLRTLLAQLAPEYEAVAQVSVVDKVYADALAGIAAMRERGGVDAVVAAGSNGGFLRRHLDLPVVLVKTSGLDVMHALAQARRRAHRVALVAYGAVDPELRHFTEAFGLGLELRSYQTEQDARDCVQDLKQAGVQAIVAPGMVVDLARAQGLEGVLLYSQASVREALDSAVEVARVARLELAKREKLSIILDKLKDGVVAVDLHERVETLNPPMARLLGQDPGRALGRQLSEICPRLGLADTLRSGHSEVEQVQQVAGRTMVVTRLPIVEQGRRTGAVLVCQDPAVIQRLDRNLRTRPAPRALPARYGLHDIIGQSRGVVLARERAQACAQSQATVLIVGESGTGKELLAQGMHNAGPRRAQPFVAVNCAAFPESLLESELFGYVEGAFTGSSRGGKAGLFEAAHTGTIFLDEIGEMPLPLQTRLLRVLQEKEVLRIGATEPTPVDVRVIAATHRDLTRRIREGLFRSDLYYRLDILRIALPPLRERSEDLLLLARHLQRKIAQRLDCPVDEGLAAAIVAAARGHDWPGNIRELENLIERAMVFRQAPGTPGFAGTSSRKPSGGRAGNRSGESSTTAMLREIAPELFGRAPQRTGLHENRKAMELEHIRAVLNECGGNHGNAARRLGISRSTLWRRLRGQPA